jgi:glycosyltransferase involved in cell wall biosynthesis
MRVLHLLDVNADFEAEHCSRMLADGLTPDVLIARKTIGSGSAYRNTPTACAGLRRMQHPFDFIHAFSPAALTAAALGARLPILFSPSAGIRPATIRWLRAISKHRRVHTIASTVTLRRMLIAHGIASDRVHLIRPGVDFPPAPRRDPELRRALGFSEEDRVILAIGESTRAAAHTDAAWAVGILHVANPKYKLLLASRGPQSRAVQSLAERWKLPRLVTLAPSQFPIADCRLPIDSSGHRNAIESAADVLLITARGPVATLPIAIAMAAARPIVSTDTSTTRELLTDRRTALLAPSRQPRLLARRILDCEADPALAWKLADTARTEARDRFSQARFLDEFRTLYGQFAGQRTFATQMNADERG